MYALSAEKEPHANPVSPVACEIACRSLHVCGLPWLMSYDASSRCPCEPTYPIWKRISPGNSRLIVRLYWFEYCGRSCRRKFAKQQNRPEARPIDIRAARRVQNAVERIWVSVTALIHVRRAEQRITDEVAAAERRFGAELLQHQLLDRIVEHAETRADAGLARSAGQLRQPSRRAR